MNKETKATLKVRCQLTSHNQSSIRPMCIHSCTFENVLHVERKTESKGKEKKKKRKKRENNCEKK